MPLISVVVPCYNQAQYLDECLQSVLDQTYTDWECIIVNDGSPDNTEDVAKKWVEKDTRFIYLSKENGGLSSARNAGIEVAEGTWILPLDADDKIGNQYLELAEKEFDKGYTVIYCNGQKFGTQEGPIKSKEYSLQNLAFQNVFFATCFYKKTDWKKHGGYDKNMIYGLEDWEFWIRLLQSGGKVYKIPQICFYYRKKEDSLLTNLTLERMKKMQDYLSKKHLEFFINHMGNFQELSLLIERLQNENIKFKKAYTSRRFKLGNDIINFIHKFLPLKN